MCIEVQDGEAPINPAVLFFMGFDRGYGNCMLAPKGYDKFFLCQQFTDDIIAQFDRFLVDPRSPFSALELQRFKGCNPEFHMEFALCLFIVELDVMGGIKDCTRTELCSNAVTSRVFVRDGKNNNFR